MPVYVWQGEDYYIVTSTFEWWPGVMIYHSRDLVNWRLAAAGEAAGSGSFVR